MSVDQDSIFRGSEGDEWFRRNAPALTVSETPDVTAVLLSQLSLPRRGMVTSICDVGCANGWRLSRLGQLFPEVRRLAGFDASEVAIQTGKDTWPSFDLRAGLADAPPFTETFDLVIVSFVLHWVDRQRLAGALAALDRLVAPDGMLLVADFLPDRPCARRYHHRQDLELFTYKQDYAASFVGLGLYREVSRLVFTHDQKGLDIGPASDQERAASVLLHKPLDAYPLL